MLTTVLETQAAAEGIPGAKALLQHLTQQETVQTSPTQAHTHTRAALAALLFVFSPPKKVTQKAQAGMCHLPCQAATEIKKTPCAVPDFAVGR